MTGMLSRLYDEQGVLQHVGVSSSFTMAMRRRFAIELTPLRKNAANRHPWRDWAGAASESRRMPGRQSRWTADKDLSWEPLRIQRAISPCRHFFTLAFRQAARAMSLRST